MAHSTGEQVEAQREDVPVNCRSLFGVGCHRAAGLGGGSPPTLVPEVRGLLTSTKVCLGGSWWGARLPGCKQGL